MNTKYPLNGRYTSLGDLVQEYGKYSPWPTNIQSTINQNAEDENNNEQINYNQEETEKLKKFYWESSLQPFNELVFNNTDKAIMPYELVWFDDIYSKTEKELNTNKYKKIQETDSSIFSFGREIRAKEIKNIENNKKYGIPFRFIIADIEKNRYYFNYKTSHGESVVIYALRNIIEICNNDDNLDTSVFLFGQNGSNGLEIKNSDLKLYIINKIESNTYDFNNNNDFISYDDNNNINKIFIFPSLFTYDTCMIYNDDNEQYKYENDNFPYYTNIKYDNSIGIFDDLNPIQLSPKSYKLLGETVWTKKHVQYYNYTYNKLPHIKNLFYLNNSENNKINVKIKIQGEEQYREQEIIFDDDLLEKSIIYFTNNWKNNNIDTNKNYYNNNNIYKLFYFCKLFLNSQRFYYSYVTSIRFIRISSLSYASEQPILRCDLGIFQNILSLTINSAIHNYETALPAGPLTLDTYIRIDINANIKYEGMENSINETFPLILSFNTIKIWTDSENENPQNNKNWIRLIKPYDNLQDDITNIIGDKYGENSFIDVFYEDENNNKLGKSDCSLGTLLWPVNDTGLYCQSEEIFNSRINSKELYTSADTYDKNTFNNIDEYNNAINDKISPFGNLRIHTVYSTDSEETIINSSYYIDVSILRHKNYYYQTSQTQTIENTEVKLYYNGEVPYVNSNNLIIPNTCVDIITSQQNKTIDELNTLFSGKYYTFPLNDLNVSNEQINALYLTIKHNNGTYYIFASGAKKVANESTDIEEQFVNTYNLDIQILSENQNNWISINEIFNITKINNNYQLNIIYNGSSDIEQFKVSKYLRITLKRENIQIENAPYYYIKNTLRTQSNITLTLKPLFINTTSYATCNETYITGTLINNAQALNIGFILYNSNDSTNLNADNINFNSNSNISYNLLNNDINFKLTSVYANTILANKQYKHNNYKVYLYYETNTESIFKNDNLFNNIYIGTLNQNNYNLYIAFNNIYVIQFQRTQEVPINNLNNVYYGTKNNYGIKTIIGNKLIASFNENVFLNNDSFNITLDAQNKITIKLKYDCNNNTQFTYITNDMVNKINLENIIFYSNYETILNVQNLSIPTSLDNNKKFVRVFIETLSTVTVIIKNNADNTNITLVPIDNDTNYNYFECDSGTSINIQINMSVNEFYGIYGIYGIYDSISGNIEETQNKDLIINDDTTIIIKIKRSDVTI